MLTWVTGRQLERVTEEGHHLWVGRRVLGHLCRPAVDQCVLPLLTLSLLEQHRPGLRPGSQVRLPPLQGRCAPRVGGSEQQTRREVVGMSPPAQKKPSQLHTEPFANIYF